MQSPQKTTNPSPFESRSTWRAFRQGGDWAHILSLVILVLICLSLLPSGHVGLQSQLFQAQERVNERQLVLEALDKLVRYQQYHRELHGRFTRDLERLGYPEKLSHGSFTQLRANYEISVLEAGPDHLLLLAAGKEDRVTVDDRYRLHANFIVPQPNKHYLLEEADRMLQLFSKGVGRVDGLYSNYWRLDSHIEPQGQVWVAAGIKSPVLGELHQLASAKEQAGSRSVASLFTDVREKLRGRIETLDIAPTEPETHWRAADVKRWLQGVRNAQHTYRRERGSYAATWESLAQLSRLVNLSMARGQLQLEPWELTDNGYRVKVVGAKGELLGEQFVLLESGEIKQIRYTQSLIQSLQQATNALPGQTSFEITELGSDATPLLDSKKSSQVQSKDGPGPRSRE